MKALKLFVALSASCLAASFASASLVGPYTPDANTLFLLHLDEAAGGSVTTNVGSLTGNFYSVNYNTETVNPPLVTTMLGGVGYATNSPVPISFNTSETNLTTGYELGYDYNRDGQFEADNGSPGVDFVPMSVLNIGNGGQTPFTLEALIRPTTTAGNQEIICTDSSQGNTSRGFQFRITSGELQFQFIANSQAVAANIPLTGPNAFAAGTWYHVAFTYNGTIGTLYWTKVDPSLGAASVLTSGSLALGTSDGAVTGPLIVGNRGRPTGSETFLGQIDEVRISNVARAANQMQFFSPLVTITQNPVSQNIDVFQNVTFNVGASSLTSLGYQWLFNSNTIAGATNSSFSLTNVTAANAGYYGVIVTNTSGNASTSSPALLMVGAGNYLSHRYSFANEPNGSLVATDSIAGANGTLQGSAAVSGGQLVLNGASGSYVLLPANLFTNATALTVDCWATYGVNPNNSYLFSFGYTNSLLGSGIVGFNYLTYSPHNSPGQGLFISSGDFEFQQDTLASNTLDSQSVHVTCVIDPPDQTLAIYTNGVLESINTNASVGLGSVNETLCYIGASLSPTDPYLTANISEFRMYSGALSAASVLQSQIQGPGVLLNDGPVQFSSQPASLSTAAGLTATFSGLAVGLPPVTYQWLQNGAPILGATNSTYSFSATSGQNGFNYQLFASNSISGTNYAIVSTNATLTVVVPPTLVWLGANGDAWDTSTLNWTNTSTLSLVAYAPLDNAVFNDLGSGQTTVDLKQALNPLSLTVNSAANYTFISSGQNGALTGTGSLVKSNTGTLLIDVTNNMTGPVLIAGGTVQVGNNDTLGAIGTPITNNASLVLDRSDATTLSSIISGTGSLTMNSGNVTVTGTNSYTGATTINSGVTLLTSATGLGATNGGINVNNGELYVTANVDIGPKPLVLAGAGVSSAGALRKGGAGLTAMYGPVTLTANTTLAVDSGATLNLTNANGINGAAANANLTLNGSGAGNIVGPLALGTGSLTVGGSTWTVAPSNSFSGLSTINAGSLRITAAASLGPVPASPNASQVTMNGGALEAATGSNINLNDGNIGIYLNASASITVDTNATFTIANPISSSSGSVALTKTGPGKLVLNGSNPFNGTLNVDSAQTSTGNDGMLVIANNAAIQNIIAFPGLPFITIRNENGATSTLGLDGTLGSLTVAPDFTLNGRNNTVPAIENLVGNNTISGGFTLGVGGGTYAFQSDNGVLTLSANLPEATPTSSGRTLTFQGAANVTVTGQIVDGSNNGSSNVWDNVVVAGPGVLSLPSANTYSGFTGVSNGVLSLTGSLNSLAGVTVSGGLLVGNGSITGPVLTQSTGAIEAGATNAIGNLTFSSSLTLGGNTIAKINKSTSSSDQFVGQTAITYGGTLTVTNLAGTLALGDHFTLFNPGASTSNFSSIAGSAGSGLGFSFTNGVLSVVVGVASTPTPILYTTSGNTLNLSWASDHIGWILQSQTNALTTGLGTNWVDISNSITVTQEVITETSTNGSVFYRLRHP